MKEKIEIEAKIELNKQELETSKQIVKETLCKIHHCLYPMEYIEEQTNSFYQNGKKILRIRESSRRSIYTPYVFSSVFLNYKIPFKKDSKYKSNLEKEIQLVETNDKELNSIMEMFEFELFFQYKKIRTDFELHHCTISLDHLLTEPERYYIEIEGKEKNISKIIKRLKLQDKPIEKRSYLEILRGENGLHRKDI